MYTVKQISEMAGVSIRTLHYYDEIGLLKPSVIGENSYRYYDDEALLRLQQILLYREMEIGLLQIKDILDGHDFDLVTALQTHRQTLAAKIARLQALIQTVDSTIMHLTGEVQINFKMLFEGFSEEKQKQYEQEIRERYDQDKVRESVKRWNSYTAGQKEQIKAEGGAIYTDLVAAMPEGAESERVQAILGRWHQHIRYFYEPTPEILFGLGQLYNTHPDFIANFQAIHPDLPAFLQAAITVYCERLGVEVKQLQIDFGN
jgi:MerR family transcriptional regulator, thiopeptide resistance regulator